MISLKHIIYEHKTHFSTKQSLSIMFLLHHHCQQCHCPVEEHLLLSLRTLCAASAVVSFILSNASFPCLAKTVNLNFKQLRMVRILPLLLYLLPAISFTLAHTSSKGQRSKRQGNVKTTCGLQLLQLSCSTLLHAHSSTLCFHA